MGRSVAAAALLTALMTGCGGARIPGPMAKLAALPGETTTFPCGQHQVDLHASNLDLTREFENRLLATLPTLPGATRLASAPVESLKEPLLTTMSSNLVTTTGWWKAPGDDLSAQSYVVAHTLKGLDATGSVGTPAEGVFLNRADTAFAADIRVVMTFAPLGRDVAERVDIQAIYWPPCPNIDALIKDPTSAVVTIERPNRATVRRTVGYHQARKLAATLRTLSPALPVMINCPAEFFGDADIVAFRTRAGVTTVNAELSGCRFVNIVGPPNATLSDWAGRFDAAVRQAIR